MVLRPAKHAEYTKYPEESYAIIGACFNVYKLIGCGEETPDEISTHCKENGFKFLVLKDERNRVADQYGAQVTPEIYLVDASGVLVYHGRIDDNRNESRVENKDLSAALDALLAGKEQPRSKTKTFGCTIKRVSPDS